ncbi:hypothetical protein IFM89_035219 [Coptis chinensis]|uniref:RNase H type-1 domain-containing protein n=1 Tax=Coptis chinensis TaxID=261450 RepID=A0A835M330_9MAGN|nr:hypothetical protein IFM89_035219 [Coptis chinensis]
MDTDSAAAENEVVQEEDSATDSETDLVDNIPEIPDDQFSDIESMELLLPDWHQNLVEFLRTRELPVDKALSDKKMIGIGTNFWAECMAILEGVELAVTRGWSKVWIETDSEAATITFTSGNVPWKMQAQWHKCTLLVQQMKITTIFERGKLCSG